MISRRRRIHTIAVSLLLGCAACSCEDDGRDLADGGPRELVIEGAGVDVDELAEVTLTAVVADDVQVRWSQLAGPRVELEANATELAFVAPKVVVRDAIVLEAVATRGEVEVARETATVGVTEADALVFIDERDEGERYRLTRLHASDAAPVVLDETAGFLADAQVSPDRRHVLYRRFENEVSHPYVASVDGGRVVDLLGTRPEDESREYRWAADASGVFIVLDDATARFAPLPEDERLPVLRPIGDVSIVGQMFVGPTGAQVAFVDAEARLHVATSTTPATVVSAENTSAEHGHVSDVTWAPDGTRIAYVGDPDGDDQRELYVAAPGSGGRAIEVSGAFDGAGRVHALAWSPDGHRLAFLASANDTAIEAFIVDVTSDDPGATRVTASARSADDVTPALRTLAWSPDGTMLAFVGTLGDADADELFLVDATDADPASTQRVLSPPLLDGGRVQAGILWSPDSRAIAFDVDRGEHGRYAIVVVGALRDFGPDDVLEHASSCSPDEQAFTVNASHLVLHCRAPEDVWRGAFAVDLATVPPTTTSVAGANSVAAAAIVPGRTRVVFMTTELVTEARETHRLYTAELGGAPAEVLAADANVRGFSVFGPNGVADRYPDD